MQEFSYKLIDDGSMQVSSYKGDEKHVVIPANMNISVIYDKLFQGHTEIESISIPEGVTDIGELAFDGCENLHEIKLPSSLTYLWGHAFARCGVSEITIPDRVRVLPTFAFKDCKNLRKIVLGKGMKKISAYAFGGCENLKEIIGIGNVEVSEDAYKTVEEWRMK